MNLIYENSTNPLSFKQLSYLNSTHHLHKEVEIVYVIEGNPIAYVENQCFKMNEKDIIIIFPNQIHMFEDTGKGKYDVVNFSLDLLFGIKERLYSQVPSSNVIHIEDGSEIERIVNFMIHLQTPYITTAIGGCINIIVSLVLPKLELKPITHSVNNIVKNILNFCLNNYSTNISLDILASELHISKYYISHLFNDTLRISFNDYINNLRITKACHELIETDKKIAEISQDVGFGSIRSFNSAFKYFMKSTPKEYRNFSKNSTDSNNLYNDI